MTWRVVRLDGPVPKAVGKYGVIISSDAMLEKTQTLLFSPLINGIDAEQGLAVASLPWHVEVSIAERQGQAEVPYKRLLLSTKIVLPTALNEIDTDGLQRGKLDETSQRRAIEKFKQWMPLFPDSMG